MRPGMPFVCCTAPLEPTFRDRGWDGPRHLAVRPVAAYPATPSDDQERDADESFPRLFPSIVVPSIVANIAHDVLSGIAAVAAGHTAGLGGHGPGLRHQQ